VKEQSCIVIPKEELVAYADGDLSPDRAEQVEEHIADCQSCRTMRDALERSLHVTQVIWRTDEAQWPKTLRLNKPQPSRRWLRLALAVAAIFFLVLGVAATWQLLSKSSEKPRIKGRELTVAEIEAAANNAALAAQMLAVADLLSSQPGGVQFAVERYNDVITSFPETEQSTVAKLHLQNLLERR
jgi:anti-sigma factor RsiW